MLHSILSETISMKQEGQGIRQFSQWSKGLKKHFGIGDVSDQDIVEDKDPSEKIVVWCNLKASFFRKMSPQDQFMLLVYAALGDRDRFNQYLLTINTRIGPPD